MFPEIGIADFSIGKFEPAVHHRQWLHLDCGSGHAARLPALATRGMEPGRTLIVIAGVHGNEYEGMEAIRRVWEALDPARLNGSVCAVIIGNPFSYTKRSRTTPVEVDGMNLARVFPGDAEGSPTERLAAGLLDLVERNIGPNDLFVDLHSGTAEVAFATMVGFRDIQNAARSKSEEAARHFGLPLLWAIPDSVGPFNAETARRGIPTVGTETTGRAGCRERDVSAYERGLWNLLAYLEILPERSKPVRESQPVRTTVDVFSPDRGFARIHKHLGDRVDRRDVLATIVDPFGNEVAEVESPVSGTVWAAVETPLVNSNDLMFMLALEPS